MSPKFYGGVWVIFAVSAALVWLAGAFTEMTAVVFGFIAFGHIFMGMMCVLPGTVAHSHEHISPPEPAPLRAPEPKRIKEASANAYVYRSA
jgi:hypothetical protein